MVLYDLRLYSTRDEGPVVLHYISRFHQHCKQHGTVRPLLTLLVGLHAELDTKLEIHVTMAYSGVRRSGIVLRSLVEADCCTTDGKSSDWVH